MRSFLHASTAESGGVDALVMHRTLARRRRAPAPLRDLLGDAKVTSKVAHRRAEFASEVRCAADGTPVRVRVLPADADPDEWVELVDEVALAALELCDGSMTVGEVVDALADGADVSRDDVADRLDWLRDAVLTVWW